MRRKSMPRLGHLQVLLLTCNLIVLVSAQGGLPDSITGVDCLSMQQNSPHICCEQDTGNFCERQCNNGFCRCVDPITGQPTLDALFPENDENIDCSTIIPIIQEVTTEPDVTTDEDSDSRKSRESGSGVAESSRTDDSRSNSTTNGGSGDNSFDNSTDSDMSDRSGYSRTNSSRSETIDGSGDSGSSNSTDTDMSDRSGYSRTNSSRSETIFDGSGDSGSDNSTRRDSERSRSRSPPRRSGMSRTSMSRSNTTLDNGDQRSGTRKTDSSTRSNSTRSETDERRCTTVSTLTSEGCVLSCVFEDDDGCPACNQTCNSLAISSPAMDEVPCSCVASQVCLRVGRFGQPQCVDLLAEGERCDTRSNEDESSVDDDEKGSENKTEKIDFDFDDSSRTSDRRRVGGANDRRLFGKLNEATVGCQEGLVCTPVSTDRHECLPENSDGPCVIANQDDSKYDCAPDGTFEPLQCQSAPEGLISCVCVDPSTGEVIAGSEVTEDSRDDVPNCDRLVGCTVVRAGQSFDVAHGDYFVDVDNCQRCLCNNGQASMCEPFACSQALQQVPLGCTYQGRNFSHGDSFKVECNLCGCRNGELRCTQQDCDEDEIDDKCRRQCMREPINQVCGINGVTYPSACAAVYCGGLAPFDFVEGACSSVDVCALYPCQDGDRCIRRGGTTCFDANGCDPDDLRLCVNLTFLVCDDDDDDDDDDAVCATNGVTYPSLCRLLQDTGNEAVAYAGECDRGDCDGRTVCGTDGVTYDNVCTLRSQSSNARVDYFGDCVTVPGDNPEEICELVIAENRCRYSSSNCNNLVSPEEGCCPLCGGVVLVAVNFDGLRDYIRINPRVRTVDDFIDDLVDSGFISEEIVDRCDVEASLTATRNIQITLSADDDDDSAFCNRASERLAAAINDLSSITEDSDSIQVPEILQFASAAVAAQKTTVSGVVDVVNKVNNGAMNGASPTMFLFGFTLLVLASILRL